MSVSILEIGPGIDPAICSPGRLLAQPSVMYTAVEAQPGLVDVWSHKPDLQPYAGCVIVGESVHLDLPNESVDYVIQRSLFGEFTWDDGPRSIHNTAAGLYEAFRVLKPGGALVVAEENTPEPPATPHNIGGGLLDAGFVEVSVYPCQNQENPAWERVRGDFWADRPHSTSWGYVMHATRPAAVLQPFERPIMVTTPGSEEGEDWQTKTFFRSASPRPYDRRIPYDEEKYITIHAKDRTITMADYLRDRTVERLFLS